ncbi:MAG: MBL fold metallo-hydrolase [Planctomycetes bacterium]|nr:MBL fold metallo-hydrolase [Planctomycetota bacterium]
MNLFDYTDSRQKTTDIKLMVIGSGSSGNCTYIEHGSDKILVDAGISRTRVKKALAEIDVELDEISAIFITHAHNDHVQHLPMLLKHNDFAVLATKETFRCGNFPRCSVKVFQAVDVDTDSRFNSLIVKTRKSSHDIRGSVVYFVSNSKNQVGIVTDLGRMTKNIANEICRSNILMLETNYDPHMLKTSNYPSFLKKRINSSVGHLSNFDALKTMQQVNPRKMHTVLCSHVSKDSNHMELAMQTLNDGMKPDANLRDIKINPTFRDIPTDFYIA